MNNLLDLLKHRMFCVQSFWQLFLERKKLSIFLQKYNVIYAYKLFICLKKARDLNLFIYFEQ